MTKLMGAKEIGELLGLNAKTVKRYAQDGKLPAFRIGQKWVSTESAIEEWVKSQLPSAAPLGPASGEAK